MCLINVYVEIFIQFQTTMTEVLHEIFDVDMFFSLKGSTLKKIPLFLSLHQPQTSHEYCQRIFAMYIHNA